MIIAERLKAARKECKLTQQQIADILRIDRSTYSYYELGTITPSIEVLKTLSAIYKVEFDWLIGADRKPCCHSNEYDIDRIRTIKDTNMSELSKEERKFVALLRAAFAVDRDKAIYDTLMNVVLNNEDEDK